MINVLLVQVVRHEYVVVLASLVDTFKEVQPYDELKELRDTTDPEADFYENIKHIQVCCLKYMYILVFGV